MSGVDAFGSVSCDSQCRCEEEFHAQVVKYIPRERQAIKYACTEADKPTYQIQLSQYLVTLITSHTSVLRAITIARSRYLRVVGLRPKQKFIYYCISFSSHFII